MEKMKGVAPKKNTPELVSGNKDVVAAARVAKRGGGMLSEPIPASKMSDREKANQQAGLDAFNKYMSSRVSSRKSGGKAKAKDMGKMKGKMAAMRGDRKARKSGGMCSSDWTAAQGEGQKPRG
jgi:hypothetical protein